MMGTIGNFSFGIRKSRARPNAWPSPVSSRVFVDQASMLYLDGAEVDYVETLEGSGFKFNNPNVKGTCGCGSSFSV